MAFMCEPIMSTFFTLVLYITVVNSTVDTTSLLTTEPTQNPTADQITSATMDVIANPMSDPTVEPTKDSTSSPTNAPSVPPTFYPKDEYDSYIEMEYQIGDLNEDELKYITGALHKFTKTMSGLIDAGFDNDIYIEYRNVESNVTALNEVGTRRLRDYEDLQRLNVIMQYKDTLSITSYTNCSDFMCSYIIGADTGILVFDEPAFEWFVTDKLQEHFESVVVNANAETVTSLINFTLVAHSAETMTFEVTAVNGEDTQKENAYYVLMSISGVFIVIAFLALLYEKGKITKKRKVDISRWAAFLGIGLQFWDFASDISLCFELWNVEDLFTGNKMPVFVAAIGSTTFLVVPYLSNLREAAGIKKYIKNNEACSTWFEHNAALFTIFVVLTGGCYPALDVISSNAFGNDLFSAGLTAYELKQMMRIKIINSVMLENVPQLCFQALYASTDAGFTSTVMFASTASLLSVIASVLGYWIQHKSDDHDTVAVQYHLALERHRVLSPVAAVSEEGAINNGPTSLTRGDNHDSPKIFEREKQQILQNRGWRLKLSQSLTQLWHSLVKVLLLCGHDDLLTSNHATCPHYAVPDKSIEIGATLLTKTGAVTHIVHLMKRDDLEIYASEILGDREDITVDELFIVGQFYAIRKEEVGAIFRQHFGLSNGFDVHFYCRKGKKKRALSVSIDGKTTSPVFPPIVTAALKDFFHGKGGKTFRAMTVEEKMTKMMKAAERKKTLRRMSSISVPTASHNSDISVPVPSVGDVHAEEAKDDSIMQWTESVMADDAKKSDVNMNGNDVVEMEGTRGTQGMEHQENVMDIDDVETEQMDEIIDDIIVMMGTADK